MCVFEHTKGHKHVSKLTECFHLVKRWKTEDVSEKHQKVICQNELVKKKKMLERDDKSVKYGLGSVMAMTANWTGTLAFDDFILLWRNRIDAGVWRNLLCALIQPKAPINQWTTFQYQQHNTAKHATKTSAWATPAEDHTKTGELRKLQDNIQHDALFDLICTM